MAYAIDPILSPGPVPGDFTVTTDPCLAHVDQSGEVVALVATRAGARPRTVRLRARGLPAHVRAEFEPAVIEAGQHAKLTLRVDRRARPGATSITVDAVTADERVAHAYLSLVVHARESVFAATASPRLWWS